MKLSTLITRIEATTSKNGDVTALVAELTSEPRTIRQSAVIHRAVDHFARNVSDAADRYFKDAVKWESRGCIAKPEQARCAALPMTQDGLDYARAQNEHAAALSVGMQLFPSDAFP
jgi:hypothetical protein